MAKSLGKQMSSTLIAEVKELTEENQALTEKNQMLKGMVQYYQSKDPINGLFKMPDGTLIDPLDISGSVYDIKITEKGGKDAPE